MEAMASEGLVSPADAGHCNGDQLKGCGNRGMEMHVSLPGKAIRKGKDGRFGSGEFPHDRETNGHACPAGRTLFLSGSTYMGRGKRYLVYRPDARVCGSCP